MRLIKMTLHNFRQYKHQEILFPPEGLFGVIGKNGAGKSTLLNAVGWCLYGKIKGVVKDDIPNTPTGKKEHTFVELYFEYQGEFYVIKRDNKRSARHCYLYKGNGHPFATGTSNLTQYVEENLLKMDHNAFCSCYYAEQDDFDNLVKLSPAKRVQTVSKLLQIEAIDDAAEAKRKKYRKIKDETETTREKMKKQEALMEEEKRLRTVLRESKEAHGKAVKEHEKTKEQYETLLAEQKKKDEDYETYRGLKTILETTARSMDTIEERSLVPNQSRLKKLQEAKERYEELKGCKTQYETLLEEKEKMADAKASFSEKERLEREKAELDKEKEKFLQDSKDLKEKMKPLQPIESILVQEERKLKEAETTYRTLLNEHQELSFHKKNLEEKKKTADDDLKKFKDLGEEAPCPICERPLGTHYHQKIDDTEMAQKTVEQDQKTLEEKMNHLIQKGKEARSLFENQEKKVKKLQEALPLKHKMEERSHHLEQSLAAVNLKQKQTEEKTKMIGHVEFNEERYQTLIQKITNAQSLYNEFIRIESSIEDIPSLVDSIQKDEDEMKRLRQVFAVKNKEKDELAFDEAGYKTLKTSVQEAQDASADTKDRATRLTYEIKQTERDLQHVNEKLSEIYKLKESLVHQEKKMTTLLKLDEIYKQYKADILRKLSPVLSEMMSADMETMTQGKYDQVELDDNYEISMYRMGEKKSLPFFSGGEKKLAALCQRIAISNLLASQKGQKTFDILAMDEVFGSMDEDRQDNVVAMLRSLNHKFKQILVITHSSYLKESFDHVLHIQQDAKGNSVTSWLTPWDTAESEALLEHFDGYEQRDEEAS
ncbi:SMC family ATPase (plasmid) [Pontibacillus sp. ALD_SL1]|uniref:AAA family ATPase n=1 Tax=Pontibacillus sp. ALD_SL1 TaxID=2777185 RepID=UPI001A9669C1|nr:SMC family ATPase [Pontibacillus sp. ALD_SL1]QST02908.1 SMC family ATPase [Pontibacillus sp. ALD_SL1]